ALLANLGSDDYLVRSRAAEAIAKLVPVGSTRFADRLHSRLLNMIPTYKSMTQYPDPYYRDTAIAYMQAEENPWAAAFNIRDLLNGSDQSFRFSLLAAIPAQKAVA